MFSFSLGKYLHLLLALLIFAVTPLLPAQEAWQRSATARKAHGNYRVTTAALPFDIQVKAKSGGRQAVVTVSAQEVAINEILAGGGQRPLPARFRAAGTLAQGEHDILLKVREYDWSVYVDGHLRAIVAAPFVLPGTIALRQPAKDAKFLPIPGANFVTDFMIEEGAKNELEPWTIQSGGWHLHTALAQALARPETSQADAKRAPLTADKSPNFYSLKGGGKNTDNIITAGYEVYDNYQMTVSMQLDDGEAGIVFYHRDEPVPEGKKPDPAKASFYAFTLRMNRPEPGANEVRLWKQVAGKRTLLARARVPLYKNQWYLPGIAAHHDQIVCFLDQAELFRIQEPLPPGGKFGMFANTPVEIRMDDVTVKPYVAPQLAKASDIRYYQLAQSGTVAIADNAVTLGSQDQRAMLVLGRAHHENLVFDATMTCQTPTWTAGLVAGWQDAQKPYLLFEVERHQDGAETYRLREQHLDKSKDITSLKLPAACVPGAKEQAVKLTVDASEKGAVRFLRNERTVLVHHLTSELHGGYGLATAPKTTVTASNLSLKTDRGILKELKQKNPVFEHDSFMRHWASPEGQWIAGPDKALWHKGDYFGDFRMTMPCIPNSKLHLAVPEGKTAGPVTVAIKDKQLIVTLAEPNRPQPLVRTIPLTPPQDKGVDALDYTLHYEGHQLWITVGSKVIAHDSLQQPLRTFGTRVKVENMTVPQLARSRVTRSNVIDEFFNESPFAWLQNGGDWQIINRFQCTPSWSHMIAECYDTMGAFWRKQRFSGDMTLEFYAGSRQGSYDYMGNLNCTIMAADNSPNLGYTVACTEWDQNLSQNWSTMYKNGKAIRKSNAYLVPRTRKGMYRRILNPLIAQGRPYHGAWFYIKLRKIGQRLEYYFDDELIMSWNDPDVLQEGLVGIWTFLHSMTLAQIKITYDRVQTRPVPVHMLPLAEPEPRKPQAVPNFASTINGLPLNLLHALKWNVRDSVGQSTLETFTRDGATALLLRNQLGSGNMLLTPTVHPKIDIDTLAGWRFSLKRTDKALLNFYYELGATDDKGVYKPQRYHFEHISGEQFSLGNWVLAGHTEVKPCPAVTAGNDAWTDVVTWFPSRSRYHIPKKNAQLRLTGFGLAQQDAILNGIWGNSPGAAYAVSHLAPIRYGAPAFTLAQGETFKAYADQNAKTPIAAATPEELLTKITAGAKPGLNTVWLDITAHGHTIRQPLAWLQLPAKLNVHAEWHPHIPDTIQLIHDGDYADKRMVAPTVYTNGHTLKRNIILTFAEVRQYQLPMTDDFRDALQKNNGKLTLTITPTGAGKDERIIQTLTLDDPKRCSAGPVLRAIKGFSPFFTSFENGLQSEPFLDGKKRYRMLFQGENSDQLQGHYLHVQNRYQQRLNTNFKTGFSVAQYPVMQMRYKADDMAHVSLHFAYQEPAFAQLSNNDFHQAQPVRHAKPWQFDETWRTWTGIVSDAFVAPGFTPGKFSGNILQIRSNAPHDQTGRYSSMALDDLVFGPAVRTAQQLAFTPDFFDLDGVQSVLWAKLPGATSYDDLSPEARAKIAWQTCQPGQAITPTLEGFTPGLNHLLVKAVNRRGRQSRPCDLPFLLDTQAPQFSHHFANSKNPLDNGTLLKIVANSHGLSPLQLDKVKFSLHHTNKQLDTWQSGIAHTPKQDIFTLNYPLIFKSFLDNAKNGDTFELKLDGLVDGAGNTAAPYTIPINVNYDTDKTGPAWLNLAPGASVAKYLNWDGTQSNATQFKPASHNGLYVHAAEANSTPFLVNAAHYSNGGMWLPTKWQPQQHPYLAFRLRRNVVRANAKVDVVLHLADKKTTYVISLDKPSKEKNELNQKQTFAWKANVWYRFAFDVPQLLREAKVGEDAIKNMNITAITFRQRGGHHQDQLHLDDFWLFGAPASTTTPDTLHWNAFDASGIDALDMTAVDAQGKELFSHRFNHPAQADLNELRRRFHDQILWFRVCALDKAGNRSLPIWLPLHSPKPAAKPAPAPQPAPKPAPQPAPTAK